MSNTFACDSTNTSCSGLGHFLCRYVVISSSIVCFAPYNLSQTIMADVLKFVRKKLEQERDDEARAEGQSRSKRTIEDEDPDATDAESENADDNGNDSSGAVQPDNDVANDQD